MTDRIERFCKTTRAFHWTFVGSFLVLAITGGALAARECLGLTQVQVASIVGVHLTSAVALVVLPTTVWLSGRTRETTKDLLYAWRWRREDLRWLMLQPRAAFGRATLPKAGKLNAGQKVNVLGSQLVTVLLVASGAWMWWRPASLLPWFLHLVLFAAWLPAFLGHLYLAVLNPSTRHALRGMTAGWVRRDWAEHHHPLWAPSAVPLPPGAPRRVRSTTRTMRVLGEPGSS